MSTVRLRFGVSRLLSFVWLIWTVPTAAQLQYPSTRRCDQTDNYYGTKVDDPYRWLESDRNNETSQWTVAQNNLTSDYFSRITYMGAIRRRLNELQNTVRYSIPFFHGGYTYYFKSVGQQGALYRTKDGDISEELFLDIDGLSDDQSTSVQGLSFSENDSLLALEISEKGSDLRTIAIMDATAKTFLSDTIKNVKFTHISWYGNEGFFYCRYPVRTGNEFVAPSLSQKLFYHKLGEPQQQDRMIFAGEEKDMVRIETRILHNKKKLLISVYSATTGNALHALNLPIKGSLDLETNFSDYPFNFDIVAEVDSMLYLSTNDYAPNNKLVKASIDDLRPKKWKDVIPEGQLPVTFSYCQRKFFSQYVKMAFHEVVQYNLNGDIERPISLPGIGSVSSFSRGHRQIVYYTFTSYLYPSTIYRYDIATGESKPWKTTQVPFSHSDYECKLIFYNSKDGNKVPMMIVHKKGMLLNGNNPVLLTGYGGFGTSLTPFYHPAIIAFLEKGGVYCVPNLRGGGEYGAKWHNAGRLSHKQNTFDDFIAAAEYMVAKGYTKPSLIAASGASNGGLLVGACLTQRPDLFKVCISSGGVFDMLRYQKYTVGGYWAHEYGSADLGSDLFKILYAYSPLHRVKSNTCYPATLMFTGDHDDRVVPFHTYKFTAALQEAQHCDNPILMHVEENVGHVMGKSLKQRTEEDTEKLAFIFQNLGLAY